MSARLRLKGHKPCVVAIQLQAEGWEQKSLHKHADFRY